MPRDYNRKSRSKARSNASPWRWLAAGFGLGMVAALVLYQQLKPVAPGGTPDQVINTTGATASDAQPDGSSAQGTQTVTSTAANSTARPPATQQENTATSKPATVLKTLPKPGTPDYDFYRMLPNFEVVVADSKPANNSTGPSTAPATNSKPVTNKTNDQVHFLQAGSFRKFTDADRRKAQLALKGIESNIHQVSIKDATWFRVYVGPTRDLARLDRARTTLAYADIETMLIRVKQ